jgi:hypothetical protein
MISVTRGVIRAVVIVATIGATLVAFAPAALAGKKDPIGTLDIQVSVPDAEIVVDGKVYGKSPLAPIKLMKGTHTVKVTKPGHSEFLDVIKVEVAKTVTLEVELIPLTAPISISSRPPGAIVLVDGQVVGTTPFNGEVDPGNRKIRLQLDGYDPSERTIELVAGGDYKVGFDLVKSKPPPLAQHEQRKPIYKKWWFWAGASAVAIGLTVLTISMTSGGDPFGGADRVIEPMW